MGNDYEAEARDIVERHIFDKTTDGPIFDQGIVDDIAAALRSAEQRGARRVQQALEVELLRLELEPPLENVRGAPLCGNCEDALPSHAKDCNLGILRAWLTTLLVGDEPQEGGLDGP